MKSLRLVFVLFLLLFFSVTVTHANCTPPASAGNDNIACDNTPPPGGAIEGLDGDDTINIDSTVNGAIIVTGGDQGGPTPESGSDTITNDGTVGIIAGDGFMTGGSGNDVIVNNGTITIDVFGEGPDGASSGNDVIINNGNVDNNVFGDGYNGPGSGSDTLVNNGNVTGSVYGDSFGGASSGNDNITNNGTANNIYGDNDSGFGYGSDTIDNSATGTVNNIIAGGGDDNITNSGNVDNNIDAGYGNDTVTIQGNDATVGGTIDGGADYDTLTFNLSTNDPAQAEAWAAEFAAANPNGGTITINGHTYTWTNFEELLYFIESPPPVVLPGESRRPFCAAVAGLDIYVVVGDEGIFSLYASAEEISAALSYARVYEIDEVVIETSETSQLWALITGELQVRTAEGEIVSTFLYQDYCGELPEVAAELYIVPLPTQSQEYPAYTIINQPYGGG
jgi:hypothetical protein